MRAVCALLCLLAACSGGEVPAPAPVVVPEPSATGWREAMAQLDQRIVFLQQQADAAPTQWLPLQELASARLRRARLGGDQADYGRTEELLSQAFALAPEGSGPWGIQARLDYALHRLDAAQAALTHARARLLQSKEAQAGWTALQADIDWQRGDLEGARAGWEAAAADGEQIDSLAGLAGYAWHTGDLATAEARWQELALRVAKGKEGEPKAWVALQRGLMAFELGQVDEAAARMAEAEAAFPGYWLVRQHHALVLAAMGRTQEALNIHLALVEEVENPEDMDAIAGLLTGMGQGAEALTWTARAELIHRDRLARFPEAAAGHALKHFLDFGSDPKEALALAEANVRLRPNADALVLLARAQLAVGKAEAAQSTIQRVTESAWVSPEAYMTAAMIEATLGHGAEAERWRQRAMAVDPGVDRR